MERVIKIGTRGSRLALAQTHMVIDALTRAWPGVRTEIVEILTTGDWRPEQGETRLSETQGGKGLFAKEIERALLDGTIDCGVHSMKDMPSFLPDGLVIDHMLPRADMRDALLCNRGTTLEDLPQNAVVGTSSLRRQAFLLARRPDLKIVPLRGNVPTRIEKLRSGQVDATILAYAGLVRLGLEDEAASIIEPDDMLPAAGQGAVGVEIRADDAGLRALLDKIHCVQTGYCVMAERAALQVLNGSCHTPIGAHAVMADGRLQLRVAVASGDGQAWYEATGDGVVGDNARAIAIGLAAGQDLKGRIPPALLQ